MLGVQPKYPLPLVVQGFCYPERAPESTSTLPWVRATVSGTGAWVRRGASTVAYPPSLVAFSSIETPYFYSSSTTTLSTSVDTTYVPPCLY